MSLHPKKLFPEVENIELLNHQVVTKRDLLNASNIILSELKEILSIKEKPSEWLRSTEVRKILKISSGTLQTLRISGALNYTKIGGTLYYKYEDLEKLLNQ
ncbi:DNA-binding protein [Flavobacterium palustre]|uniref:DNA-binding protein n=1 Tax=Flavobacterium palustre TaxID=1476463 RepID=A0ABQ1HS60_9FLAO|nr:helix-turn-helix domain-containing protein [Flavobacterium palustre]GGA87510.1 DNA-binding protein [Flavobacterium palustre]